MQGFAVFCLSLHSYSLFSTTEYIYGLATAVFVAVCIVISVVRWFHTVQDSLEIVGINGIPVTILFNNP